MILDDLQVTSISTNLSSDLLERYSNKTKNSKVEYSVSFNVEFIPSIKNLKMELLKLVNVQECSSPAAIAGILRYILLEKVRVSGVTIHINIPKVIQHINFLLY